MGIIFASVKLLLLLSTFQPLFSASKVDDIGAFEKNFYAAYGGYRLEVKDLLKAESRPCFSLARLPDGHLEDVLQTIIVNNAISDGRVVTGKIDYCPRFLQNEQGYRLPTAAEMLTGAEYCLRQILSSSSEILLHVPDCFMTALKGDDPFNKVLLIAYEVVSGLKGRDSKERITCFDAQVEKLTERQEDQCFYKRIVKTKYKDRLHLKLADSLRKKWVAQRKIPVVEEGEEEFFDCSEPPSESQRTVSAVKKIEAMEKTSLIQAAGGTSLARAKDVEKELSEAVKTLDTLFFKPPKKGSILKTTYSEPENHTDAQEYDFA